MKKNQHYIPIFYQKLFSSGEKSIGKYMIDKEIFIPNASIKKTGVIEYYYGKSDVIEDSFMRLESIASRIIKDIIRSEKVPGHGTEQYEVLLLFLVTFEARVQKMGEAANRNIDQIMKSLVRMKKDHGQLDPIIDEETLKNYSIGFDIPTLKSVQAAIEIYGIIRDLRCNLIISDVDRAFITSDNPVVRYNYMYRNRDYRLRGYGLGNMGIQLFLPLSPKHCLYIYDHVMYDTKPSADGNFHITKAREIDKLNCLFHMNSYNFILFDSSIKERYIKILTKGLHNLKDSNGTWTFGPFIGFGFTSVNKTFYLPIFKIRKELRNMSLPSHMAGPLRPIAKEFETE